MKRSFSGEWDGECGGEKRMRSRGHDLDIGEYGDGQFGKMDCSRDFQHGDVPQNTIGTSQGRVIDKNNNMPQVDSPLATFPDIINMSMAEMADYEVEDLAKLAGKAMYTGVLKLLANGTCTDNRNQKQQVFQKSLNLMLSKTVAEIYSLNDSGTEAIRVKSGVDVQASLAQLVNELNNMQTEPENAISVMHQAMKKVKCTLGHNYRVRTVTLSGNRYYYMGEVTAFGNVVIGRGNGMCKKMCRHSTYIATLQHLKTKSFKELMVSLPEEPIPIMDHLPMEERLAYFFHSLPNLSSKTSNIIGKINTLATQNDLSIMLVYRTPAKNNQENALQCDLYLEKVFIASGKSLSSRRKCRLNVYNQAWEVLKSTTADALLSEHIRITDEELEGPHVIDVVIIGPGKLSKCNNLASLKQLQPDISKLHGNSVESMVIIENSDWSKDRLRNAFRILTFSATQNQLVMQWNAEDLHGYYSCTTELQGEVVGYSLSKDKYNAINLAAADALFKLYETQDVIQQFCQRNDKAKWIPFKTIVTLAENLKNASNGCEIPINKINKQDKQLTDKNIMPVLSSKLKLYAENKLSDELIIGPGMGHKELQKLKVQAKKLNLICDKQLHKGYSYALIYKKLPWVKLCEKLKETQQPYGQFVYVERTKLPKYSDIENSIVKKLPEEEEVKEMKVDIDVEVKKEIDSF